MLDQSHILNYILNKFCPIFIVGFICFFKMGFNSFEPYIILGMMLYACSFNYKVGHAVATCEKNNLL